MDTTELSKDIYLSAKSFETISPQTGEHGGGGFETTYIASERKVVHENWYYDPCSKKSTSDNEELQIPESISTKEELINYVVEHRPLWISILDI